MKKFVISIFLALTMFASFAPLTYAASSYGKNSSTKYRTTSTYNKKSSKDDATSLGVGALMAVVTAVGFVLLPLIIGGYVYTSFALMKIAEKLGDAKPWFAWIPILNTILLFRLGDQNPYYLLFVLLPGVGAIIVFVLSVITYMNICEKFGRDRLLGLLKISSVGELVLLGVLAWGKDSVVEKKK